MPELPVIGVPNWSDNFAPSAVRRRGDYCLRFCAELTAVNRFNVRAEKFYVADLGDRVEYLYVDTYPRVAEITRHSDRAFTARIHTAEWEALPGRPQRMFIGRMVPIQIRGLKGARTLREALTKVAAHYDETKDNLVALSAA